MTGRLARRYARALMDLARVSGTLERAGEELERAGIAFADPRLRAVLSSPIVQPSDRLEVSNRVIGALALSADVANLLRLLARRGRLDIVADLVRAYEGLLDRELGRVRIVIRSSVALETGDRERVIDLARRLTSRQNIIASAVVEPDLLGGVLIDIGGTVYDGSLKTQLERLSREMAAQL